MAFFLRLALHRRRARILHFEPIGRAAAAISGILALAEAVVLDLVQPLAAGWQLIRFGREAWRDEPGREV